MIRRIILALAVAVSIPLRSFAELKPEEVAVVAAKGSRNSEGLASYYVKARGLPADNICLVDMPKGEVCARDQWTRAIRPEIRKWLAEHDRDGKIRCLVTVWDVPLKIGPAAAEDPALGKYKEFLQAERTHRIELLGAIFDAFQKIAPSGELTAAADIDRPVGTSETDASADDSGRKAGDQSKGEKGAPGADQPVDPTGGPTTELAKFQLKLERALQAAQQRIGKLPEGDKRNQAQYQLSQLAAAAGGTNVILHGMNQRLSTSTNAEADAPIRTDFDLIRGRALAYAEIKALLDQTAPNIHRDALVLAIVERYAGILGTVEWIDEQLTITTNNETGAAFDSELSLVLWPDDYELLRWQPDYLRPGYDNSQLPKVFRTLMVSRIDAPTLTLAKGLIDTAIKVEKEGGLKGKVYIDCRGIGRLDDPNVQPGSYADFDRALLFTAKGIKELAGMEVVLDDSPQLFQPGKCPDAALYCGWYSLAKYVDAFDWKPGAVAYHLASSEAETLHDPQSQVWCKRLLEDGVCVTIGPVYEPYLASFPRPNEFFGMLLSGDLTLVECYYRSSPFNSWMMILVGDPLYRPFKRNAGRTPAEINPALTTPPTTSTTPAPAAGGPTPAATPATPAK